MNSWKEAPHLFANGKFKCLYNHIGRDWAAEIRGIDMNGFILKLEELNSTKTSHFDYCTLIARPIKDLSDEELSTVIGGSPWNSREYVIETLINQATDGTIWNKSAMKMLSLGVYPLNQNQNDIIWRYENTNS